MTLPTIAFQPCFVETAEIHYDADACYRLVLEMLRRVIMESAWDGCSKAVVARRWLTSDEYLAWKVVLRLYMENTADKQRLIFQFGRSGC